MASMQARRDNKTEERDVAVDKPKVPKITSLFESLTGKSKDKDEAKTEHEQKQSTPKDEQRQSKQEDEQKRSKPKDEQKRSKPEEQQKQSKTEDERKQSKTEETKKDQKEEKTPTLEEIAKARGQAQQGSNKAIREAEERYNQAMERINEGAQKEKELVHKAKDNQDQEEKQRKTEESKRDQDDEKTPTLDEITEARGRAQESSNKVIREAEERFNQAMGKQKLGQETEMGLGILGAIGETIMEIAQNTKDMVIGRGKQEKMWYEGSKTEHWKADETK